MPHLVVAEELEIYEPNIRQCYYTYERRLKYYKNYTQSHCESECLVDYMLDLCGCVPYYMPHFPDTNICGTDLDCYFTANNHLYTPELDADTAHALIDDCHCLPTCTQLSYTIQITELVQDPRYSGTSLQITNKAPFFTKDIRTELHSLSEFFANCGGSLGVSIFSIVELVYFCTAKFSAVESTVSEYVRKSTIHGIAYVGDDERHKFESTKSSPNSALFYSVFLQNILLQRDDQDNYDILAQFLPRTKILTAKWLTYLKDNSRLNFIVSIIPSTFDELRGKKEKLWSRDYGFTDGLPLDNYTYPFRAFNVDDSFSVSFEVDSGQFCLFDSEYGMLLHAPDEVPLYDRHSVYSVITADQFHMVEITPHLVVAEGIEKYDPNVRKCYYTYERKLKYYKTYTRNHCEAECFAEYALAQCGCVPYYMPHFPGTKICGTDLKCFWTANYKLFAPELKAGTAHAPIDDCNCLPTCIQMSYSYQVTPLTRKPGDSGSGLQIRIKAPFFTKNIRTELHSLSEFFSNCGGSLGLFLGVSIFSLVELIYFCTVRLYLHSKRSDRKRCSEKTNEPMNSTFVE
ncbi:hypothetical protein HA402_013061 [Bradysia odoriphaga]|nr:hypothetical protein HA402_013061 [Bradysia odoriphaga]